MNEGSSSLWRETEFRAYLSAVGFTGMAFAMQQLLSTWLLIGVLLLPADRVGLLQAAIGLPGFVLMLWGGASADRTDPRTLLVRTYALAPLLPLWLMVVDLTFSISVWSVVLWGLGVGVLVSFSSPAQQAMLNRVSGPAVQEGVTASTAIMFLVQVLGLTVAGQMDRIGLTPVLAVQALCFAVAAVLIRRLSPQPPPGMAGSESALRRVWQGLKATYEERVIFAVLGLNFVSSIFNAGAFLTVFPFIVKRIYGGDALLLAVMMAVFFGGAAVSNLLMLRLMPLDRPGRWFMLLQLSRIGLLLLLWIEPSWWVVVVTVVAWGLNMGVTSTLARAIVQESTRPEFRGRILSVFTLALLGSPPLGAMILGWMIEAFGTLNALLPGMVVSLLIFLHAVLFTGLWSYRSPRWS